MSNYMYRDRKSYRFFKRIFDIFTSFLGIILLSWLFLIIAIIIKFNSKGPVLFRDKRVGRGDKLITVYKFRSMYQDAEERLEKYLTPEQLDLWKRERKLDNDPRITSIGKLMRKTSIDELPQLFNVLKGDLSLIGNRPITKGEMEMWFTLEEQNLLVQVKPGITGYWQVYGRSDVTFQSGLRQKDDLYYVCNYSFKLDVKIFFRTIYVVLFGKGAK